MFKIQTTARFDKDCKKQGAYIKDIRKGMERLRNLEWLSREGAASPGGGEFHLGPECVLIYRGIGDTILFQRIRSGPGASDVAEFAKATPTIEGIDAFLKHQGAHEVTEEDKKTDWYKFANKKPSCFKPDKRA